jgi:hypothetical protein
MMKPILNWQRWAVGLPMVVCITALSTYIYIDRELGRMYGGFTDIAEFDIDAAEPGIVAITNVNVLVPAADRFLEAQTVLIRDGIIDSIAADTDLTGEITRIDGTGMFLVPGYTESHAHLWESQNDLLLYLANGVTQIREMNGIKKHLNWKAEIEAGRLGPDMFVVAPQLATFGFIEGLFVGWTQKKTIVRSDQDVERAVQMLKAMGYDAIKASSFLDPAGYTAISVATRANSMPLIGHIPNAVGFRELWASNQREIAHIEELVKTVDIEFGGYTPETAAAYLEFVRSKSEIIAERLYENGIAITSTLTLSDSFWKQKEDLHKVLYQVELQYMNPGVTEGTAMASRAVAWLGDRHMYRWPDDITEEQKKRSLIYWQTYAEAHHIVLDALIRRNVTIMVGTDANVPVMVPGFSLHDEMLALNQAGMSASEILASATHIPGAWMGMNTGEITAGFKANLVLLRENPLEDIGATDTIETVFVKGRVLSRENLNELLRAVEEANESSMTVRSSAY